MHSLSVYLSQLESELATDIGKGSVDAVQRRNQSSAGQRSNRRSAVPTGGVRQLHLEMVTLCKILQISLRKRIGSLSSRVANKALPPPPSSTPSTPSDSTLLPPQASISSQQSWPASRMRGQDLFDASIWKDPSAATTFYKFIASLR